MPGLLVTLVLISASRGVVSKPPPFAGVVHAWLDLYIFKVQLMTGFDVTGVLVYDDVKANPEELTIVEAIGHAAFIVDAFELLDEPGQFADALRVDEVRRD